MSRIVRHPFGREKTGGTGRKRTVLLSAAGIIATLVLAGCSGGSGSGAPPWTGDTVVKQVCWGTDPAALTSDATSSPSATGETRCFDIIQPVATPFPLLPTFTETGEATGNPLEVGVVGCIDDAGNVARLGQAETALLGSGSEVDALCASLPELDGPAGSAAVGEAYASSWKAGIDRVNEMMSECAGDMLAAPDPNQPVSIGGREQISSGLTDLLAKGAEKLAPKLVSDFMKSIEDPGKREVLGLGLVLLGVGVATAAGTLAAPAFIASIGVALAVEGISQIVQGEIQEAEQKDSQPAPSAAAGGGKSGQPDPLAEDAPDSCWVALSKVIACAGTSTPCADADLAAAMAAYRERKCQESKAQPNPDDPNWCDLDGPSTEETAAAVVRICTDFWSNRTPGPDEQVTCPLVVGLASGPLMTPLMKICTQVEDASLCPTIGGEIITQPKCEPGTEECKPPIPPGPELPQSLRDFAGALNTA